MLRSDLESRKLQKVITTGCTIKLRAFNLSEDHDQRQELSTKAPKLLQPKHTKQYRKYRIIRVDILKQDCLLHAAMLCPLC